MGRKSRSLRHGSLFSGIGGFDLAASWMGWKNVFHCEINPFCRHVLKYYYPKAHSYEDIKNTDFSRYRDRVDILTGGFPCQPYSLAGKRLGKEDERHLWPEMLRAIREIRPQWIVGENVLGIVSWNDGMVFEEVQSDLEAEGYEVQPYVLPAAGVGAPHRRDRVWFVAHADGHRGPTGQGKKTDDSGWPPGEHLAERGEIWGRHPPNGRTGIPADAVSLGCNDRCDHRQERPLPDHFDGDAEKDQREREERQRRACPTGEAAPNGRYRDGQNQRDAVLQDHWANWPTQSPICTGDDGIPPGLDGISFSKWRTESIKAGGNAIVPQVALQLFRTIASLHDKYPFSQ